jgi:pyruvate dehydrogenase E2 component (dihydrolipoamide acetyltransferase)
VTLGATEPRPVVVEGEVVVRPLAPLFVRADHRIVDAHALGLFTNLIRDLLANPAALDADTGIVPRPLAA